MEVITLSECLFTEPAMEILHVLFHYVQPSFPTSALLTLVAR